MANEIKINLQAQLANGGLLDKFEPPVLNITQTTKGISDQIIALTTSDTAVTLTGITANGQVFIHNLDPTNYVQYGPDNSGAIKVLGRLKPGEWDKFRLDAGASLRMKANTATCNVRVLAWCD